MRDHQDLSTIADATLRLVNNNSEMHWKAARAITKGHQKGQTDDEGARVAFLALGLDALKAAPAPPPAPPARLRTQDVPCPLCEAPPRQLCRTRDGRDTRYHSQRQKAAKEESERRAAA